MTTTIFKLIPKYHTFVSSGRLWVKFSQKAARHIAPGVCRLSEFSQDQEVTIPCTVKIQYPLDNEVSAVQWNSESISLQTAERRVEEYEQAAVAAQAETVTAFKICRNCGYRLPNDNLCKRCSK